jgi:two-component system chemotaxis response regulator CheY
MTQQILKIFGFKHIFIADNGADGYELACAKEPDIIITDWLMDPVDGLEFTRMIRQSERVANPYVPIIMMTGYSSKIRVEEARDVGITEFLVKPFTANDLYTRIQQIIEKPRQFVATDVFFGPDRRRKNPKDYTGPVRRDEDDKIGIERSRTESKLLNQVREDARDIMD